MRLIVRMSDQGPTVFNDRYEMHRRLARGGMSDVYLARDLLLDRPVAVKVLFAEYAKDPTFVERFRREAQAAANLNHPNVVAVYDWGQQSGTYFIVMEYVEGAACRRSCAPKVRCTRDGRPRSPWTWPRLWASPTATAWCTATSSRATS